jgi:hypothetical protein
VTVFAKLSAPFPPKAISWRAQAVSNRDPNAPKAMALAYIDARDVMNRLDEVCGPDGWEDSYVETPLGRVICTIRIRTEDGWVSKSDGAGKTDVEGDKGGISDAFKRAAVKWGIGRYLYDMKTPWVRCELYNGKWSKWTAEGQRELDRIAGKAVDAMPAAVIDDGQWALIADLIARTGSDAVVMCEHYKIASLKEMTVPQFEDASEHLRKRLPQPEQKAA